MIVLKVAAILLFAAGFLMFACLMVLATVVSLRSEKPPARPDRGPDA